MASPGSTSLRNVSGHGVLFGVALTLRLIYLFELRGTVPFSVLVGDAATYVEWGRLIAEGGASDAAVFYQAPLYPYFIAALFSLLGQDWFLIRVVQSVLGAAACSLVAFAGQRFFPSPRAGWAAGALLAVYPPAIFFDGLIQKASLALFLTAALLALLGQAERGRGTPAALFSAGLVLGGLSLTRENSQLLLPVVLLWSLVRFQDESVRRRLGGAALFVAGAALVLLPVALRNQRLGGEFLISTSQFGTNFYIGNGAGATGTYRALLPGRAKPQFERLDATVLAESEAGRRLSPGEVSDHWRDRTFREIWEHPGSWARLMARKAHLTWHRTEIMDTEGFEVYRDSSVVLRVLGTFLHMGVLAPLGLFGIALTRRGWRGLWLLYAMLFASAASVTLFYVFARYRFPLVPLLCLFAGAGLVEAAAALRSRSYRAPAVPGVLALVAALLVCWPVSIQGDSRAATYVNFANALRDQGESNKARVWLDKALHRQPEQASAHYGLGVLLGEGGDVKNATGHFLEAVRLEPGHSAAHYNLAVLLDRQGRTAEAVERLRIATAAAPSYGRAISYLAGIDARQGRLEEAVAGYRRAVRLEPANADLLVNLGVALARSGADDGAATAFEKALALDPGLAGAHNNLGLLRAGQNRIEDALDHFRKAVQLQPDYSEAHNNLGTLLARGGRLGEALRSFDEAVRADPNNVQARENARRLRADPEKP